MPHATRGDDGKPRFGPHRHTPVDDENAETGETCDDLRNKPRHTPADAD